MITIVEPKEHIDKLWGKQKGNKNKIYRLMRYVIRVNHEDKVLLHNVVTGQLIVLDQDEAGLINQLPLHYTDAMGPLVEGHFIVECQFDEHQQVVKMRKILRTLYDAKHRPITNYVILPTTACNARCYYCFEQGMKTITMSESMADSVVEFISDNCGDKREVYICWFGGEPTVASQRIDQISAGLREKGIKYSSVIISNGFLFDQEMVSKAKSLWNVTGVQITVDGVEANHNRIKAFMDTAENPYQRVMNNIGLLLEKEIDVVLRMNFDIDNYEDFDELLQDVVQRYDHNPHLSVQAHPVLGEYRNTDGIVHHGDLEWLRKMNCYLNSMARNIELAKKPYSLPFLRYRGCAADQDGSIAINANGTLSRCMEQFSDDQLVGNVTEGITNERLFRSWKQVADYANCQQCVLFPRCVSLTKCGGGDRCFGKNELLFKSEQAIYNQYMNFIVGGNAV